MKLEDMLRYASNTNGLPVFQSRIKLVLKAYKQNGKEKQTCEWPVLLYRFLYCFMLLTDAACVMQPGLGQVYNSRVHSFFVWCLGIAEKHFKKLLKLRFWRNLYVVLNKRKQTFLTRKLLCNLISNPSLNLGPVEGDRLVFLSSLYSPLSSSGWLVKCLIYFKAKRKVMEQGKFYQVPVASAWAGWLPCILLQPILYFWYGMCVSHKMLYRVSSDVGALNFYGVRMFA